MNRHALYHCGLDCHGHRHWRLKTHVAIRNCRRQRAVLPKIVAASRPGAGREVWRTGLHRRQWQLIAARVRADRRSFLTTLAAPALVSPLAAGEVAAALAPCYAVPVRLA